MLQHTTTKLIYKKEIAPTVWQFNFSLVAPEKIEFIAGQYMILKVMTGATGSPENSRHFSICSPSYTNSGFELVVQMVEGGIASNYLGNLNSGDTVFFDGPAGVFTLRSTVKNKVFIATGSGIAPIRSILHTTLNPNIKAQSSNNQFPNFYLFWGLRELNDVYFLDELISLSEKNTNFKFKICLSKEVNLAVENKSFCKGRVNQYIENLVKSGNQADFEYYLSGNRLTVELLRQFVLGLGAYKENILFEKF